MLFTTIKLHQTSCLLPLASFPPPQITPLSSPLSPSLSTLYIYSTMKFTLAIGALLAASATAFAPNAALTRAVVASSSSSSALE